MFYCVHCNFKTSMKVSSGTCPSCQGEVREITNTRLVEIIAGLNKAVNAMSDESVMKNPKEVIGIAKIIEKGEKILNREHAKRLEALSELEYEIQVIESFSGRMGYTLNIPDETDEPDPIEETDNKTEST